MLLGELLRRLVVSRDPLTATDEMGFPREAPPETDASAETGPTGDSGFFGVGLLDTPPLLDPLVRIPSLFGAQSPSGSAVMPPIRIPLPRSKPPIGPGSIWVPPIAGPTISRSPADDSEPGSNDAGAAPPVSPADAASQIWRKIVDSYNEETRRLAQVNDAARAKEGRLYGTYTMPEIRYPWVYSGRTSGDGTLEEIVQRRYSGKQRSGFYPAIPDKETPWYSAVRGREQQLHDFFKEQGRSSNIINPIWSGNPFRQYYLDRATDEFGQCCARYDVIDWK